jgi:hypothetical protein
MNDDATGKRFSQVYLTGGEALPDSKRARFRIAVLLRNPLLCPLYSVPNFGMRSNVSLG